MCFLLKRGSVTAWLAGTFDQWELGGGLPGLVPGLGGLALLLPEDGPVHLGVRLPAALRLVVVIVVILRFGNLEEDVFITGSDGRQWVRTERCYTSVADPGCLSRILIFSHLGSRIQKQQQKRGVKKNLLSFFFCSHKFHKIGYYFIFEMLKNKFGPIIKVFTQTIFTMLSHKWVWDPGSEIRDPEKTYPGSRGQKGTGSRIRIRNTDSVADPLNFGTDPDPRIHISD